MRSAQTVPTSANLWGFSDRMPINMDRSTACFDFRTFLECHHGVKDLNLIPWFSCTVVNSTWANAQSPKTAHCSQKRLSKQTWKACMEASSDMSSKQFRLCSESLHPWRETHACRPKRNGRRRLFRRQRYLPGRIWYRFKPAGDAPGHCVR